MSTGEATPWLRGHGRTEETDERAVAAFNGLEEYFDSMACEYRQRGDFIGLRNGSILEQARMRGRELAYLDALRVVQAANDQYAPEPE